MFDSLFCGTCARIFRLCAITQFIQHKSDGCSRLSFGNPLFLECSHCDECYISPLDLIAHVECAHRISIIKHRPSSMVNDSNSFLQEVISVSDTTSSSFIVTEDKSSHNSINSNDGKSAPCQSVSQVPSVLSSCSTNYSSVGPSSSIPSVVRKTCCLVDGSSPCTQMSSCPILFSRDSDGEAESELRDNSLKVSNTSNPDTTSLCNEITYCTQTPLACGERKSRSNFICEYCKREFSQKVHLQKHIMSTHTKNKPFKCSICSYQTVEKSHLKTHFRKHTGEKPFSCTLCTYRAAQHSTLKQHCIKKHRNAFLSCRNCSVRFVTLKELENHQKLCFP
ncbi:putative zinc finger protein [Schistosoma mansoni]|uniref:putative zinc finger protein n=1 Tax=Schistosoma mansoni TaxID=6183 RepID=UPI00022DCC4B|nr:putative zinc finger protein [Schistosoma mansoni]|eukprot:XP_018654328.1 putative zinc finger protein [Schistosoma mansoni]